MAISPGDFPGGRSLAGTKVLSSLFRHPEPQNPFRFAAYDQEKNGDTAVRGWIRPPQTRSRQHRRSLRSSAERRGNPVVTQQCGRFALEFVEPFIARMVMQKKGGPNA